MDILVDKIPGILKYGLTGLSALLLLCAFVLLRDQNRKEAPNAMMLTSIKFFLVCCIGMAGLSLLDSIIRQEPYPEEYKLVGFVKKEGHSFHRDIKIDLVNPPHTPNRNGEIVGVAVHRNKNGDFPIVYFKHPDYATEQLDLNRKDKVTMTEGEIRLNAPVILVKTPE